MKKITLFTFLLSIFCCVHAQLSDFTHDADGWLSVSGSEISYSPTSSNCDGFTMYRGLFYLKDDLLYPGLGDLSDFMGFNRGKYSCSWEEMVSYKVFDLTSFNTPHFRMDYYIGNVLSPFMYEDIRLEFNDASNTIIDIDELISTYNAWDAFDLSLTIPTGATQVTVYINIGGNDAAGFDNIGIYDSDPNIALYQSDFEIDSNDWIDWGGEIVDDFSGLYCGFTAKRGVSDNFTINTILSGFDENDTYFVSFHPADNECGFSEFGMEKKFDIAGFENPVLVFDYYTEDYVWGGPVILYYGQLYDSRPSDRIELDVYNSWETVQFSLDGYENITTVELSFAAGTSNIMAFDNIKIVEASTLSNIKLKLNQKSNDIVSYPNPVTDKLNIIGVFESNEPYTLYNMQGQIIATGVVQNQIIDFANYPTGIYMLKVGGYIERIIKN